MKTTKVTSYRMTKTPFLSIITRVMYGKRDTLFKQHQKSVAALTSIDFEQIFITDYAQKGLHEANRSFQLAQPYGEYVYLLDDDDFFTNPDFIDELKKMSVIAEVGAGYAPDVIFFKMKIKTGDGDEIYPKAASWHTRTPRRGQIGGSCFAVRRWVFYKYIHAFDQQSFGDWHFITKVLSDPEVKTAYIDKLMSETGKVSRGKAEAA